MLQPGHVLGDAIVEQDVGRSARSARHALRHPRIVGGHHVGPARGDDVGGEKWLHEIRQPVAIDAHIGVGVGDDLPVAADKPILRAALRPLFGVRDDPHVRIALGDRFGGVLRPVVDEDDFVVRIVEQAERARGSRRACRRRCRRRPPPTPSATCAAPPPANGASPNTCATARPAGFGRRARSTSPNAQSSTSLAAAPPFVGPGERDCAAGALGEGRSKLHRGQLGLPVEALADAVGARFGQQQRQVAGDVLQPRQVAAQLGFVVQVDVERADVEERQVEVFGRREVDVGEQGLRRDRLRLVVELAQELARRAPGRASARPWREFRCRARTSTRPDGRAAADAATTSAPHARA